MMLFINSDKSTLLQTGKEKLFTYWWKKIPWRQNLKYKPQSPHWIKHIIFLLRCMDLKQLPSLLNYGPLESIQKWWIFILIATTLGVYLVSVGNYSSSYLKIFARIGCIVFMKGCDLNTQHFRASLFSFFFFFFKWDFSLNLKSDFLPTGTQTLIPLSENERY